MDPNRCALTLRRIAAAIHQSEKPDRGLVVNELQRVLAAMNDPQNEDEEPSDDSSEFSEDDEATKYADHKYDQDKDDRLTGDY
jgi:hypothetical protein